MTQTAVQAAIHQLFSGRSLTAEGAEGAMSEIMNGEATAAQVGAFLAALRSALDRALLALDAGAVDEEGSVAAECAALFAQEISA